MFRSLGLFCFFLFLSLHLEALHIIGGEMTYTCNSPGNYTFRMKVYRDCQGGGAGFDDPARIAIYRGGGQTPYQERNVFNPAIKTLNPQDNNPCVDVPPDVCVQEGIYSWVLNLPVSNQAYYIVYQRCCRNNSISNIVNPQQSGSTYGIELTPEAQNVCNSSPDFVDFPPPLICVNQPLNFDHSAVDPDGDDLVYEFCSPLLGGSNTNPVPNPADPPPYDPVTFVLPDYSAINPVGGNPVVSINSTTGLITGTPDMQGQFVVGICVSEYRNGVLLSQVQRDFQFNITFCEPRVDADLDGVDVGEDIIYNLCADTTIAFINESTDEAYIQEYLWLFDLPGQPNPLSFNTRDVTMTFPGPGNYTGQMILNPGSVCTDTANIAINITPDFNPDFISVYDTCVVGPVEFFDATPQVPLLEIADWTWTFGDGDSSSIPNPIHEYIDPGSYPVSLTMVDSIGCTKSITKNVDWFPVPPLIIFEPSRFVGCPGEEITFTNLSFPIDDTYQINWDFGDGRPDSILSPTHRFDDPGIYSIFVEITSPFDCYISDEFPNWIEIDSFPVADFSWTPMMDVSNFQPTVQFEDQSRRAIDWFWTFGDFRETIGPNPLYTWPDTGRQEVQLIVEHPYGCTDTIVKIIDVVPKITHFMPNAFTPNGDGNNEEFGPVGIFRGIRNYSMIILDRWGGQVFSSTTPEEKWNGRVKNTGRWAKQGVYSYRISFTGPRGKPHFYTGFTTLIK